MSKLQLFRDFVNERLAAASLEIFWQYEKTFEEYQEQIFRSEEKSLRLQRMLDIAGLQPELLYRTVPEEDLQLETDVQQQLSHPEPPQIKEEPELWTSQEENRLREPQSDTTIFTLPCLKTLCDPDKSSQLAPIDQTATTENGDGDPLHTNTTEEQIKAESDEEVITSEPASDVQTCSVTLVCPTAQRFEEEVRAAMLPDVTPITWKRTQVSHFPSPRSKISPNPSLWARPVTVSYSGSESEDVHFGEAESKTVEKPYRCELCDRAFTRKGNLISHRKIHTGEKPYQCEECGKVFNKKGNLASHRRIHTGAKPFPCRQCDKAFRSKSDLDRHTRTHTGEKPYECQDCEKAFTSKGCLIAHRKTHTGEKPYQCEDCDNVFRRKSHLVTHRRIHSGDKPYQCDICEKVFRQMCSLVYHRKIHMKEQQQQSEGCDIFYRNNNFVNHRTIHTGNESYQCEDLQRDSVVVSGTDMNEEHAFA